MAVLKRIVDEVVIIELGDDNIETFTSLEKIEKAIASDIKFIKIDGTIINKNYIKRVYQKGDGRTESEKRKREKERQIEKAMIEREVKYLTTN